MSATGHQVLSFVTSGEMTRRSTTITRSSLPVGETAEAKDVGFVVELVMPAVAANGLWFTNCPAGDDQITKSPRQNRCVQVAI
jgi:hypothetical protein